MEPVKIAENIYWVGAIDYSVRDFHGYKTNEGSTYNAFLIMDEKITLIDTVKDGFCDELMSRISKIVDPAKIDQVVSNHAELDHAGALAQVMNVIGMDKPVYTSTMGAKILKGEFRGVPLNLQAVSTGSKLSLGKLSLDFIETKMVHWPDSMFSFCPELGILFSQDAFGMHYASSRRFDDEVTKNVWSYQAIKYFANILPLFSGQIAKTLESVASSGLLSKIKMICPDHGFIWRSNLSEIVGLYSQWVKQEPTRKAVVVFDSMWHSTECMAHELADALAQHNVLVKLCNLKKEHRSDVVTEAFTAGAVLVGSPTMNNDLYPSVADILCYLRGLKLQNKVGAAFGSYGWSGEAPKMIQKELEGMKYQLPNPEVKIQWCPDEAALEPIKQLAKIVADALPKEPVPPTCGL